MDMYKDLKVIDHYGDPVPVEKYYQSVNETMKKWIGRNFEQLSINAKSDPRGLGNELFKIGQFSHALGFYNFALMECHDDDAEKSLIYANRAACYLEMKFFKNCLNNLDLAEPHYPAEKMKKLHERRENCLKLMAVERDEGQIKLEHPFDKLSYPANPKLPFFIDAIELKQDEVFGRHLVTSQDLKAGDVIALIDRSLKFREHKMNGSECANCLTKCNYDFFASEKCEQALFCSQSCVDEYTKIDHEALLELEASRDELDNDKAWFAAQKYQFAVKVFMQILNSFDSIADMRKFVEENKKKPKTVFDFDDLDESNFLKNVLCCILTAETKYRSSRQTEKLFRGFIDSLIHDLSTHLEFNQFLKENRAEHGKFIESLILKINGAIESSKIFVVNLMGAPRYCGSFFHPCMLLLNHSCDPNIFTTIVDGNKVALFANRPIKAGQQLFVNYTAEFYSSMIPTHMKNYQCVFKNSCDPCQKGWRKSLKPRIIAKSDCWQPLNVPAEKMIQCREEAARKVKAICKHINKNFAGYNTDAKVREDIVKKLIDIKRQCEIMCYPDIQTRFKSSSPDSE